jgi:hypothetical protein
MAAAGPKVNPAGTFTRLGINLPSEVRAWILHRAIEEGTSAGGIVAKAIADYRAKVERTKGKP